MSRERRHELTDEEWARIQSLLPPERGHWGRPRLDNRNIVNGMVWILRTGAPWRDLPEDTYILDSTIVRAHQQASGAKGGSKRKGLAGAGADLPVKSTC
jgi:transposase